MAPFVTAAAADTIALGVLIHYGPTLSPSVAAIALHIVAILPFIASRRFGSSERALGAAYVFALPLAGAPIAALALRTEGHLNLDRIDEIDPDVGGVGPAAGRRSSAPRGGAPLL